jgi:hypothetical protein
MSTRRIMVDGWRCTLQPRTGTGRWCGCYNPHSLTTSHPTHHHNIQQLYISHFHISPSSQKPSQTRQYITNSSVTHPGFLTRQIGSLCVPTRDFCSFKVYRCVELVVRCAVEAFFLYLDMLLARNGVGGGAGLGDSPLFNCLRYVVYIFNLPTTQTPQ